MMADVLLAIWNVNYNHLASKIWFAARNYNDLTTSRSYYNDCEIDKWVQAVNWYKTFRACDCVTNVPNGLSCKQIEFWYLGDPDGTGGLACKADASPACKDKIKAIVDMYKNASNAPQCLEPTADKDYQQLIKFTIPLCT